MRFFEDVSVGDTVEGGVYRMDEDGIVGFAEEFDPQPIHTDRETAAGSPFGGLIASGWHTCAATMRVLIEGPLADHALVGATGVDDLRFLDPVRPGDELSATVEVVDREVWDEDRGHVTSRVTTTRGDGTAVLSMRPSILYRRRGDD